MVRLLQCIVVYNTGHHVLLAYQHEHRQTLQALLNAV